MTQINIWCIARENWFVFKITIEAGKDLFDLRKAILEELPNAENVKATQLTLWRVDVALSVLKNKYTSIESYLNDKLEEPADFVGDTISNVEGSNIRIVVEINNQPVGVPEVPIDISAKILKALVQPPSQLPHKTFLNSFLNEKPEVKIPLSPSNFSQIYTKGPNCLSEEERDTYFVQNIKEECTELFTKLIGRLIFPSAVGNNEDSFHGFWDDTIKTPILIFGKSLYGLESMDFDRNTNKKASTGRNRPDMVITVKNICPFRGEEKAPNSVANPRKELTDKFKEWIYGNAPYLLAYYAIGYHITFVTLSESDPVKNGSSNKRAHSEIKSETICEFDLREFSHRIRLMNLLRNVCRILPIIINLCPTRDTADFLTLHQPNGTIVELGYNVKKIFKDKQSVDHLQEIYTTLLQNKVRFTDKLEFSTSYYVHLEPRGLQRKPRHLKELLKALSCILTCLKEMHEIKPKPVLHRDIRWPNIVLHKLKCKQFILIDFDYAAFGSERNGNIKEPLKDFSEIEHAPELLIGKHSKKVDIWGVGHLIDSCDIEGIPKRLREFASRLQKKNPKNRPTALEALTEIIEIFMMLFPRSPWLNKIGIV